MRRLLARLWLNIYQDQYDGISYAKGVTIKNGIYTMLAVVII
jgi:hypothetical protein